jgi:hypothetical protein
MKYDLQDRWKVLDVKTKEKKFIQLEERAHLNAYSEWKTSQSKETSNVAIFEVLHN